MDTNDLHNLHISKRDRMILLLSVVLNFNLQPDVTLQKQGNFNFLKVEGPHLNGINGIN